MLSGGFFVCGFHVAFLATHLPGVIASCGLPLAFGAWSLAMLGLFNIVGSVAMGWAVGRWRMKSLLSFVYATRGLAVLIFLLAPKTGTVVLVFAAVMGLTFLSTVPPTAGLVAKFFGVRNMATLFGIVMLTHQVGGFLGAWLGGRVFEATGSYNCATTEGRAKRLFIPSAPAREIIALQPKLVASPGVGLDKSVILLEIRRGSPHVRACYARPPGAPAARRQGGDRLSDRP